MELFACRETSTTDPDLQEVDVFYLERIIQKGKGCTRLMKASSSDSGDDLVVKLFPKNKTDQCSSAYLNEQKTASKLCHNYLMRYQSCYKDVMIKGKNDEFSKYSAIIMEYNQCCQLFDLISKVSMSEKLVRTLFKQMISVVEYIHDQGLAFLDIKLESFLITEEGVKLIIDFDSCQDLRSANKITTPAGSCGYRPPEYVKGGRLDLRSGDVYALGVVLFMLVTGTPPYTETEGNKTSTFDQYYDALRKDTAKFWRVHEHYRDSDSREPFSSEFKQLIEGMLAEKIESRFTLEDVKKHAWYKEKTCSCEEVKKALKCYV